MKYKKKQIFLFSTFILSTGFLISNPVAADEQLDPSTYHVSPTVSSEVQEGDQPVVAGEAGTENKTPVVDEVTTSSETTTANESGVEAKEPVSSDDGTDTQAPAINGAVVENTVSKPKDANTDSQAPGASGPSEENTEAQAMAGIAAEGASSTPVSSFDYKVIRDGIEITRYKGNESEVVIPDTIEGRPVVVIGRGAFIPAGTKLDGPDYSGTYLATENGAWAGDARRNLTKVTIPATVTHIQDFAFSNNNLTSVNLPTGLKWIGSGAFQENRLTQINLPSSLVMIDKGAFRNNQLTSVAIPEGITEIHNRSFAYNPLSSITLPSTLKKIGVSAFSRGIDSASLTGTLELPAGVEEIDRFAFSGHELTTVIVPDSVTYLGPAAFVTPRPHNVPYSSIEHKIVTVSVPSHLKGKVVVWTMSGYDTRPLVKYIYRD